MIFLVKQKKSKRAILFALFLFCLIFIPIIDAQIVEAKSVEQAALDIFKETGVSSGFTDENDSAPNVYQIIGIVVNIVLGFVGVIFLVLVIAGGFMWMTASGNEEKVKKGRDLALQSVIGLAIVLAAYLLTTFVVKQILTVV